MTNARQEAVIPLEHYEDCIRSQVAYLVEARLCQAAAEGTDGRYFVRAFECAQCDAGLYVGQGDLIGNATEQSFQLLDSQQEQESLVPLDIKSISPRFNERWASWAFHTELAQKQCCQALILSSAQEPNYVALVPLQHFSRTFGKSDHHFSGFPHHWILHPLPAFPPELTPTILPLSQLASALANLRAFAQGSGSWYMKILVVNLSKCKTESVGQPEQPIASFPHDFLLVWDWKFQENLQDQEYETLIRRRVVEHPDREIGGHSDKMTRLWNVALILEDAVEYEKAEERLRKTVEGYEEEFGKEDLRTLTSMEKLALIYKKMEQWEKAEKQFKQVIQTREQVQGTDHPDNTSSMANLASMYRGQGHLKKAESWETMADLIRRKRDDTQIMEEEVVKIARSFDEEVMKLLLDRTEVQVTGGVITAAAENESSGKEVMKLLLDQKGNKVQITEGAVIQIAGLFYEETMKLLLDQKGSEVQITEDIVTAAAGNDLSGEEVIKLLLDRKGTEVRITEAVVIASVKNKWSGIKLMKLLLDRKGNEVQITEGVITAAAGNGRSGEEVIKLLLNQKGNKVQIIEGVVTAVARNGSSGDTLGEWA